MEPESPSAYPQVPATCPYPEPTQSSPPPTSWRSILILSSHLHLGLPNDLFPSDFSINTLCTPLSSPIRATCPAHLIRLDFTNRTILGKEYRSFSSAQHYKWQIVNLSKSRMPFLKFWLFENCSNSSIISIFIYIFMWYIVLVINFIRSHCKSLNEEVTAACM